MHWIGEIRGWQDFTVTRPSWFIKDLTVPDAAALKIEVFLTMSMAHGVLHLFLRREVRESRTRRGPLVSASPFDATVLDRRHLHYVAPLRAFLSFLRVPPGRYEASFAAAIARVTIYRRGPIVYARVRERASDRPSERAQHSGRAASLRFFAGRGTSRPLADPARGASREITFSIFLSPWTNEQAVFP